MIQKVMLATINADHPQRGMLQAFGSRFQIYDFDYMSMQRQGQSIPAINDQFVAAACAFKPDLIWMQLQETNVIQEGTMHRVRGQLPKTVIVHWMGDCRTYVPPLLTGICRSTHMSFISNVGQIPMYAEHAGGTGKVSYLQIGLDWDEDVLGLPDWTPPFRIPEVVFCGGYYGSTFPEGTRDRLEAVTALRRAGIDVGVVSPGPWPDGIPVVGSCHVKQQHHVWKRAKVCLNVNHFNNIELYYSDRQIISMAGGRPLVCKYVPGLEREFQDGIHCLFFRDQFQLIEQVKRLLMNPEYADSVGRAGQTEVKRAHSWASRIDQMLPIVERIQTSL